MTFPNLDNARGELQDFLNAVNTVLGDAPTSGAAVADVTITTDLTGVDTGTDMTAAQAAQIEADLASLTAAVNALILRLETFGLISA